jgi:hypothetical protein
LFNFKKYLHEEKLLEEWKKIDPKGTGLVNYRDILFKSHRFFECFSVSNVILVLFRFHIKAFQVEYKISRNLVYQFIKYNAIFKRNRHKNLIHIKNML